MNEIPPWLEAYFRDEKLDPLQWDTLNDAEKLAWIDSAAKAYQESISSFQYEIGDMKNWIQDAESAIESLKPKADHLMRERQHLRCRLGIDPVPGQLPLLFVGAGGRS